MTEIGVRGIARQRGVQIPTSGFRLLTSEPWRGRNRLDEGVKVVLSLGMVPPLSGRPYSCQWQLCGGCSRCV